MVQALAGVVEAGVHDPRLGGLTFTSASASDDLRNVRIFYTVFGGGEKREAAREGLAAARGYLRRELAQRLALRYVPTLTFEYDASVDTAARIGSLLRERKPS